MSVYEANPAQVSAPPFGVSVPSRTVDEIKPGRHASPLRAVLTLRRLFYVARHRG